jgi:hypothetical protein
VSLESLRRLQEAHENLISALDDHDVETIEARVEQLRSAIAAVKSAGAWRECDQARERAQRIRSLGEAARVRVNFLTDRTAQRLQMLASARGEAIGATYRRRTRQPA